MQYIPIKTRVMQPPKDDLFEVLDESPLEIQKGDLILITSKVVAIHQGRCVPAEDADKAELIKQEADYMIEMDAFDSPFPPLTITNFTILGAAGIDASNADGHYVLLPKRPFDIAEDIWNHLKQICNHEEFGVIITDSRSQPMRYGATGVSLAWWGFHPIESHKAKTDLFGRPIRFSVTNIVDAVAAGSSAVSGETNESTPIVIARDVPNLQFVNRDTRHEVFKSEKEDLFYPLLKPFYESKKGK